MTGREKSSWGLSLTRHARRLIKKIKLGAAAYGILLTTQLYREIKTLFTFHPGERCELDYTKYGVLLYPNKAWTMSVLYFVGLGVDHRSTVIKGYTITAQPTAVSGVRLYKNCVLPGPMWLPKPLAEKYGHEFDVCGFDRVVAMDNGKDLQSNSVIEMLLLVGAILLCTPPKRGDLKGTVERTIKSLEQMFFEAVPGYIKNVKHFLSAQSKKAREVAYANAALTVAEFEELLLLAILAYNQQPHPKDKRPRIQVYREGLDYAPPLLPVGLTQIDTIFSMTYTASITPQGVQAETWHYNSPELQEYCSVGTEKAHVCVPVDDVRMAIVYHKRLTAPLRVPLTTHPFSEPTPLELARLVLTSPSNASYRIGPDGEGEAAMDRYFNRLAELQTSSSRQKGAKRHEAMTAAAQADNVSSVDPPQPRPATDNEMNTLFGTSEPED